MRSALLVAALGLLVSGSQLVLSSSSYGGGQEASYAVGGEGYGSGGGYGDAAHGGYERPRVNLGISLKVPAMKINLGRMNMPRISIRAKIKQSQAPKVINVPEMHIDTNSKIPGPQGAQAVGSAYGSGGDSYGSSYGGAAVQSYAAPESSNYGGGSEGGYSAPAPSYGAAASNYVPPAPPSYAGPPSYGQGAPEASSGYAAPPSNGYSAGGGRNLYEPSSYEMAPANNAYGENSNGYGATAATQSSYEPSETASYGGGAQVSSYSDSMPVPTSYGQKPYGSESQTTYSNGGYGPAAPSNYGPANAGGYSSAQARPQNTRSQYGSSPNAYNAPQQQHLYGPAPAAKSASSYSPSPSQSYSSAGYRQQAPETSAYASASSSSGGYARAPAAGSNYQANKPKQNYIQSAASTQVHAPAASYQPQPQASYPSAGSGGYSSAGYPSSPPGYEPASYQPLEAGHTLLTATNDNYEGLTQMSVASNPPKEYPKYGSGTSYGPSVSYETSSSSSYGAGSGGSAGYSPKPAAPQASSYAPPRVPSYGGSQYNVNQQQSYQPPSSQPIYDDSAATSYGPVDQGNYGARMGAAPGASGNYVEAY